MVDVGVGDDYLFELQVVLLEIGVDGGNVVAGVYDDGFAGVLIGEDGAVAGDGADAEDLMDHLEGSAAAGREAAADRATFRALPERNVWFRCRTGRTFRCRRATGER